MLEAQISKQGFSLASRRAGGSVLPRPMILTGYSHFGGVNWDSAALKNTLAYSGVLDPRTRKPLTEAMCLGIGGGIGVGYSFCPSIPRSGQGSGISVVGRHRVVDTGGSFQKDALARLGCTVDVCETAGVKAAYEHVCRGLSAGRPVIIWTSPLAAPQMGYHSGTCGMYLTVVHGVDEARGEAHLGDCAPTSLVMTLADLSAARQQVCSHRNRSLHYAAPKRLDAAMLQKAVAAGAQACADELLKPRLLTFGLPGLVEWSKVINNRKNAKGWPKVYPGGRLYWALHDTFDSIETAGTGGGLFRPIFAEFLNEAADVLGRKALHGCAAQYQALGREWTALAQSALPDKVKPFKDTKKLLLQRRQLWLSKGPQAAAAMQRCTDELRKIDASLQSAFPLDEGQCDALLAALSGRITELHAGESAAAQALAAALR